MPATAQSARVLPSEPDATATLIPFGPPAIDMPREMALRLRTASASHARRFALMMHERASAAYDDHRTQFWLDVLSLLD